MQAWQPTLVPVPAAAALISPVDTNDDGKITREEFLKSFVAAKMGKGRTSIAAVDAVHPKAGVLEIRTRPAAPPSYLPAVQAGALPLGCGQWSAAPAAVP